MNLDIIWNLEKNTLCITEAEWYIMQSVKQQKNITMINVTTDNLRVISEALKGLHTFPKILAEIKELKAIVEKNYN